VADSSDRIALPIRVHEFLLACAGRIDDDALTDARELLAVAELDRAVELLTASLVAGRIPVTADERDMLLELVDAVRSAPALVDRIIVDDNARPPRHRFTTGAMDDPSPETGVLDAVARVIEVLPDIRSLSCVWRTTPAGAPAGPVPQRLVLVETGPDGFAPSTAYRVEQALRRAGIRAAVEVVEAGSELSDYHGDALAIGRRVSLRGAGAARAGDSGGESASSLFADPPTPRPVTSTRRRTAAGAHAEKRPPVDTASGRWTRRISSSEEAPAAEPEPDPAGQFDRAQFDDKSFDGKSFEQEPMEEDSPLDSGVRPILPEAPAPAKGAAPPTPVAPPALPPVAEPEPAPAMAAPPGPNAGADADLNNRERDLLRQLHEELAKREGTEAEQTGQPDTNGWSADRSTQRHGTPQSLPSAPGTEFNPAEFNPSDFNPAKFNQAEFNPSEFGGASWHAQAADQTAVNGIPPYGSGSS
jgi:hypothetical protein